MRKIIMDADVDVVARVFSNTMNSLPIDGYGIRKKEALGWKLRM